METILQLRPAAEQLAEHRSVCDNLLKDIERKLNIVTDTWLLQASEIYYTDLAKELLDTAVKEKPTTQNQWQHSVVQNTKKIECEEISNRVFSACIVLTWRNQETVAGKNGIKKFPLNVSYSVSANAAFGHMDILAFSTDNPFIKETNAMEYISGLKKAFEKKFFYDQNPVIPLEYRSHFLLRTYEVPMKGLFYHRISL